MLYYNKKTLKEFLDGEIVINCQTQKEHDLFFEFMTTKKISFLTEHPSHSQLDFIKNKLWKFNKEKTCYSLTEDYKGIQYSNVSYYIEKQMGVVKFRDGFKSKEPIKIKYLGI